MKVTKKNRLKDCGEVFFILINSRRFSESVEMKIKVFVMDVDGTLTDGKLYVSADGELVKSFNIKE